jgi:hypothetical protein
MIRVSIFSISLFILSFTACQKTPLPEVTNSCDGYCSYTVGSYWIYQHVLIDSNDVEQILTTTDTVSVVGDSIINGQTYFTLKGRLIPFSPLFGSQIIGHVRDSLHYLVNSQGTILFSSQDFSTILSKDSTVSTNTGTTITNYYSHKMKDVVDSVSLPAGTFKVLNYERTASSTNPATNLFFSYKNNNQYYTKGVGKVLQSFVFSNKRYLEHRLLEYHIE